MNPDQVLKSMSDNTTRYGILVGVDGSAGSDAAIRWAANEAVLRGRQITLMHVVTPVVVGWPMGPVQANIAEWQEDNAREVIADAQKVLQSGVSPTEMPIVQREVRYAGAVSSLVDATKDSCMVVIGASGTGAVGQSVLGSVSSGLLHHSHCPVTVVHEDPSHVAGPDTPVLVGIDGSPASDAATAFAYDEASRRGVDLGALHARR